MKRMNFWFLPLLFCSALLGTSHAAYAAGLEVRYDREQDRLSVQAEQVSLTQVLGRIAAQSGVEILMDPSIEKTVSMSLQGQPLERALKQIARGLSYVMLYDSGKKRNPTQTSRLTTMKLLPQGKQDSPNLVPVAVLNARAGRQGRSSRPEPAAPPASPGLSAASAGDTPTGSITGSMIDPAEAARLRRQREAARYRKQQEAAARKEMRSDNN